MVDYKPTISEMETEEEMIAAAKQIVKALEMNKNLTDDAKKILANLGMQLCDITRENEHKDESVQGNEGLNEIERQLNLIQDKVLHWERDQSIIWACGQKETYEYLKAVDEARKLTKSLESLSLNNDSEDTTLLHRAHDVLQMAMARLEEEFRHLLVQNRLPFEPEHMSFRSSEDDIMEAGSVISSGDDSLEDVVQRDSMSRGSGEYIIELVHPDVIPDLKSIANLMFDSNYGRECSQAFISIQKEALDDCIYILEVEKLSIEDVLKMEWKTLNSKIRRWIGAMKIFVRVYLASEKLLSEKIFGDLESVSSVCFVESSKNAILQLLNFGEAIAIGPHKPEKLIRILDMYEVLAVLIPDIDTLYYDDTGSCVRIEYLDILRRLGDCAKATFLEFENAVASNVSTNPFPGGGVHHLTKYVMNYIKTLADYQETLDVILKDHEREDPFSVSLDMSPISDEENIEGSSLVSQMAQHFQSLTAILECNLEGKSKLYRDDSLQHVFLMNNIHYMAERVKGSKLRTLLGDGWIRKHNWKFQQHEMNYERATWSSKLSLLKDDGIQNPGSNSISRTILKERLQSFYLAFEEVYKNQTGWSIPDSQLRDDLHISTSLKVIQAYRTFVGRHINHISERHIKYTADDLEDHLLDLFEGSQKSLHGGHKK
ncbi:exocyst complex component EXO70B1-like [Olea europaea subsp. europaea]|uniref:Exocyst subunit Exo70 family protein n=1 Tax=Olea europaea subsp. europaea TaxID=158383 RepID=A0A8S0RI32_OLEEU|nr:exocyst complex component EXO70B1-like [Olea europaea subsp. europaea]